MPKKKPARPKASQRRGRTVIPCSPPDPQIRQHDESVAIDAELHRARQTIEWLCAKLPGIDAAIKLGAFLRNTILPALRGQLENVKRRGKCPPPNITGCAIDVADDCIVGSILELAASLTEALRNYAADNPNARKLISQQIVWPSLISVRPDKDIRRAHEYPESDVRKSYAPIFGIYLQSYPCGNPLKIG